MDKIEGGYLAIWLGVIMLCAPLAGWGQDMPQGEYRDKTIFACTACHGLDNIFNRSNKISAADWEFYVYEMVARGAPVREEDMQGIIDYLADHFSDTR